MGSEKLGIPIRCLSYIVETPDIALLPGLPSFMAGIVQYRGDIFSVVNIAQWFSLSGVSAGKLLATVELGDHKLGVLIDEVLGFQSVTSDDVAVHLSSEGQQNPVSYTTRSAVAVLGIEQLFDSADLQVGHLTTAKKQK